MTLVQAAPAIGGVLLQYGRVFELDELAWLEREAVALRLRESWRQPADARLPALLHAPQRLERGFRRLADHPRLHDLMAAIVGAPLALAEARLRFRGPLDLPEATLHALVDLGASPDAPCGGAEIDLRGRLQIAARAEDAEAALAPDRLVFAASYRVARDAAHVREDDDCLWPTSFVRAG